MWKGEIVVAGPTTSIREEPYEEEVSKRKVPGSYRQGRNGKETLNARKEYGAVIFTRPEARRPRSLNTWKKLWM